jgi:hypothetical protein
MEGNLLENVICRVERSQLKRANKGNGDFYLKFPILSAMVIRSTKKSLETAHTLHGSPHCNNIRTRKKREQNGALVSLVTEDFEGLSSPLFS